MAPLPRLVLLAGVAIATALAIGEAASRRFLDFTPAAAARERRDFLERLPGRAPASEEEDADANLSVRSAYGAGYELHPFFGYVARRGRSGSNNQGFFSGGRDYPYRKRPGELVIGLFGGSVAMQLAGAPGPLLDRLRPELEARGHRSVVLLPFAAGGWRQPQTFAALVHYLDTIDLAVNLDGFNEVVHLHDATLRAFPATFPWSDVYGSLVLRATSTETVLRRAAIVLLNRAAAGGTLAVEAPLVRRSALAHLAWRAWTRVHAWGIADLRALETTAIGTSFAGIEPPPEGSIERKRAAYLDHVADLVRYSDLLARRKGKAFFHFVQPNQYLRGSKPLSDEERSRYTTNVAWAELITSSYRKLEETTRALRAEGIESHFLGDVFSATTETVYSDDCCHLNELGVALVASAIGDRIAAAAREGEAMPLAAPPHRSLDRGAATATATTTATTTATPTANVAAVGVTRGR